MAIVYPRTMHREAHFTGSATVRDVVIGMSDGLTVPFALAAGLSGAVNSSFVVLVAGVAEMVAGSMAMGLGGYLAARSKADSYRSELAREHAEVRDVPEVEAQEVRDIFRRYGLDGSALEAAVHAVRSSPEGWVRFMMREKLGLEEPDPARAPRSAVSIGLSYIAGGLLPLAPYLVLQSTSRLVEDHGGRTHAHACVSAGSSIPPHPLGGRRLGLRVRDVALRGPYPDAFRSAFAQSDSADVFNITTPMSAGALSVLYRAADGVLANSGREPFGLVGLETMAAGGTAYTGNTGEESARHLENAVVLDTADPSEATWNEVSEKAP
jgi:vacuolar iron transporter family protein